MGKKRATTAHKAVKKSAKKKSAKDNSANKGSKNAVEQISKDVPASHGGRLYPPQDGATVRFYRIGHGDCFLVALAGTSPDEPVYVLIDCGYKPGSPGKLSTPTSAAEIWDDIRVATGGHIQVAIITHEHQDHVNGITKTNIGDITIGETWLAWTEDPEDDVANRLRKVYDDKLRGLVAARDRLNAAGDAKQVEFVDNFLEFELGGDVENFQFAAAALAVREPAASITGNKGSMALLKQRANDGVKFIRPHERILSVPGTEDVRVFALGPPRNQDLLEDLDPEGGEEFPDNAFATASPGNFFGAAARATAGSPPQALFAPRYSINFDTASNDGDYKDFFSKHYGPMPVPATTAPADNPDEAPDNADFRRIDNDWLGSAAQLALALNSYTNNTSLVLAFELGRGGKVLLFAADAQRGNWISWSAKGFQDGHEEVTVRDLLARTVLYKVGHHCSHNATLNGVERDDYANLGWMGLGEHSGEFTAMITAVWAWAQTQKGWYHPYPPIKKALLKKSSGRVFQTDTDYNDMQMPDDASVSQWKQFQKRARGSALYFDYTVSR